MGNQPGAGGYAGEALPLAELLRLATAANDRAKYYLSLLQFAAGRAEADEAPPVDLSEDRALVGIDDASLDCVIAAASCVGDGLYRVPHARRIVTAVLADVDAMLEPLRRAVDEELRQLGERLSGRLRAFVAHDLTREADAIDAEALARLAGVDDRSDTLHQLVMEAHRALLDLERRLSERARVDETSGQAPPSSERALAAAFAEAVRRGRGSEGGATSPPTVVPASDPFAPLARHAGLLQAVAHGLSRALEVDAGPRALPSFAAEARHREREADAIIDELREAEEGEASAAWRVLARAHEAADALEAASFRLGLLPEGPSAGARVVGALRPLAELATASADGYLAAIDFARRARGGARGELQTLRHAVENLALLEREAHARGRAFLATLMATPWPDARWLVLSEEVARAIERASAACVRAAEALRALAFVEVGAP